MLAQSQDGQRQAETLLLGRLHAGYPAVGVRGGRDHHVLLDARRALTIAHHMMSTVFGLLTICEKTSTLKLLTRVIRAAWSWLTDQEGIPGHQERNTS